MKRIRKIIIAVILCFAAFNPAWMIWREAKYSHYTDSMEKTVFSQLIVPRFACEDDEVFDYSVKYPDYISFTGNLCVGVPDKVDIFGGRVQCGAGDVLVLWQIRCKKMNDHTRKARRAQQ